MTMCDVGDAGEMMRDVTHVTSAARPGQGVVDDSVSIGLPQLVSPLTAPGTDGRAPSLYSKIVSNRKKIVLCLKLVLCLYRLQYKLQGEELEFL